MEGKWRAVTKAKTKTKEFQAKNDNTSEHKPTQANTKLHESTKANTIQHKATQGNIYPNHWSVSRLESFVQIRILRLISSPFYLHISLICNYLPKRPYQHQRSTCIVEHAPFYCFCFSEISEQTEIWKRTTTGEQVTGQ